MGAADSHKFGDTTGGFKESIKALWPTFSGCTPRMDKMTTGSSLDVPRYSGNSPRPNPARPWRCSRRKTPRTQQDSVTQADRTLRHGGQKVMASGRERPREGEGQCHHHYQAGVGHREDRCSDGRVQRGRMDGLEPSFVAAEHICGLCMDRCSGRVRLLNVCCASNSHRTANVREGCARTDTAQNPARPPQGALCRHHVALLHRRQPAEGRPMASVATPDRGL